MADDRDFPYDWSNPPKKDIYYQGKIYKDYEAPFMLQAYVGAEEKHLKTFAYYEVLGKHPFTDWQDVSGLYELIKENHGIHYAVQVAIPITPPQSPDLERKARELVEKFRFGSHGEDQHLYAKQCAIIHLELLIKALKSIFGQDEDKQPDIVYYTKLIELINKL